MKFKKGKEIDWDIRIVIDWVGVEFFFCNVYFVIFLVFLFVDLMIGIVIFLGKGRVIIFSIFVVFV